MKKYYVFLFGIIFIFIFTGCSFLSFNSPISYSEFDVGSSSSETDNIIPHEEDSSSDNNDVSSAEKYSLQGTTQSRYLTGGVPPVRFSM